MVNAQAERVFGYDRAEMLGQSIEMLVPTRFRDEPPAAARLVLRRALYRARWVRAATSTA